MKKKAQMSRTVVGIIILIVVILVGLMIVHFSGTNSFKILNFIFGK